MFEEALFGKTKNILALLVKAGFLKDAYLAGGTACALQLGHRVSYDLDFFTGKEFNAHDLVKKLERIEGFKLERTAWGTILGRFGKIKFSLFYYSYPVLYPSKNFNGIKIADLRDIAAMKILAISDRGIKRDFIDLYAICHNQKISLEQSLFLYDRKYGKSASDIIHVLKSFTYFEDAEKNPMPKMIIPLKWEEVKNFFQNEVKKLKLT